MAAFQYCEKVIAKVESVHSGAWWEDERQHTQAETRVFPAWVEEELGMVKLWNRLPREVVLTPSLGFSRPDRIKALSNVASDLTADHALSRDWTRDNPRCLPT